MTQSPVTYTQDRLLSLEEVVDLLKVSTSTMYRIRKNKALNFPEPVELGNRRLQFSAKAVSEWMDERKGNYHSPHELEASTELMQVIKERRK